ncbi:MAG TPA: hypothetical protein VFA60_01100 [Terriglobales bacterium]|nr:hypothetical protein [Terriglobales bacterium]
MASQTAQLPFAYRVEAMHEEIINTLLPKYGFKDHVFQAMDALCKSWYENSAAVVDLADEPEENAVQLATFRRIEQHAEESDVPVATLLCGAVNDWLDRRPDSDAPHV